MDLIKKNLVSVICAAIAVICVILIFFPFSGMFSTLETNVQQSWKTGEEIRSVMKKPRYWPSLSDREEDKVLLEQFPTAAIISHGKTMTTDWNNRATEFLKFAIATQRNQLQPLVPNTLPTLTSPALGRTFIDTYQRKFGIYLTANGTPDETISIFKQTLVSTQPPTENEVKTELERVADEVARARTIWQGNQIRNKEEVERLIQERQALVSEQLRTRKAVANLVYADPNVVFEINSKIAGSQTPNVNDVFAAQVTLWIQEQVAAAIRETNEAAHAVQKSRSEGILASPIKRLLQVQVTHPFLPVAASAPGEPPVLPSNPTVKVVPNYTSGPFGHAMNEFYDVVKFETSFICDAGSITQVLTGLNRGRYFVFRRVSVESVDSAIDASQGYMYGPSPVVKVSISGNYLFLREFMKSYMPVDIIRGLTATPGTTTPDSNTDYMDPDRR